LQFLRGSGNVASVSSLSLLAKILRPFRRHPSPAARIIPSGAGLVVEAITCDGTSRFSCEWSAIDRAEAFKRDLLSVDLICLELRAHGEWVEVNEEMAGWDDLLVELPERLPGALAREELYAAVMKPAFAERRTLVFERIA
jgi:hypothetical protein